jgi:hypothetical protein
MRRTSAARASPAASPSPPGQPRNTRRALRGPRRRSSSRISGCVPASPSGYLRPACRSSISCWSRPYARSQRRCCGLDRRCLFDRPRHLRSDSAVGSHGRYPELATATATAVNRRQTCRLLVTGIALSTGASGMVCVRDPGCVPCGSWLVGSPAAAHLFATATNRSAPDGHGDLGQRVTFTSHPGPAHGPACRTGARCS